MNWIVFGGAPPPQGVSQMPFMLIILGTFAIFYFVLIRPQRKKQKDLQMMVEAVKKGDRVMTSGGIFGTVSGVKDNIIVLRVADGVNIEVLKSAVASVIKKE